MNTIKTYIGVIVVILALIFAGYQWWSARQAEQLVQTYKQYVLQKDSLVQIKEGQYKKLVDDTKTTKDLVRTLRNRNDELYNTIQDQNKDIVSLIAITQSFDSKVDTVFVKKDSSFTDYYPSKENYFVKYSSRLAGVGKRIGEWSLSDINIDLVVSEKVPGLFEADLVGPSFINISSLQVESLPMQNFTPDNFGWLLGGSLEYNLSQQTPGIDIYGGMRIKKTNVFIKAGTDNSLGAGLLQEF